MVRTLLIAILVVVSVACSDNAEPDPATVEVAGFQESPSSTEAPAPTSTPAAGPSPSAIPTDTPAPELTATATSEPTPTSTPAPTPLPAGYFLSERGGFSLTHQRSWGIEEDDFFDLVMSDFDKGLTFFMTSVWETEPTPLDEIVAEYVEGMGIPDPVVTPQDGLMLAGSVPAARSRIAVSGSSSSNTALEIVYAHSGNRSYQIAIIGPEISLNGGQLTFQEIYDSMDFFSFYLYGLDRDETLVDLGGDPLPEDLDPAIQTGSPGGPIGLLYSGLVRLTPGLVVEPYLG